MTIHERRPILFWIGCAILQVDPKRPPGSFSLFYISIFIYSFKYKTIETYAQFKSHNNSFLAMVHIWDLESR